MDYYNILHYLYKKLLYIKFQIFEDVTIGDETMNKHHFYARNFYIFYFHSEDQKIFNFINILKLFCGYVCTFITQYPPHRQT